MKKIYCINDKQYEVYVSRNGQYLIDCSIYEIVHPERKFFRKKYVSSKTFLIEDYLTIDIGVKTVIGQVLQEEEQAKERDNQWEDFSENY